MSWVTEWRRCKFVEVYYFDIVQASIELTTVGLFSPNVCSTRLVTAVPEEQSLSMQIVRGTNVLELHESAIVDLCNMSGASDKEVENCVVDFLSGGYDIEDEATNEDKEFLAEQFSSDDDLIDRVMNLWADEVPPPPTTSGITDPVNGSNIAKKRPKPWSSRSSGSGTWVRDPKTGVMRNIDS